MKFFFRILNVILITSLLLLLVFNLFTLFQQLVLKNDLPQIFGYSRAQMVSGSMEDAISVGDMIIIREAESYNIGDIVTYRANSLITHRVIARTDSGYITKGDANNVDDGEIPSDRIEGRVVLVIPYIGIIFDFLRTPLGIFVIVATAILFAEAPKAFASLISKRKGGAAHSYMKKKS